MSLSRCVGSVSLKWRLETAFYLPRDGGVCELLHLQLDLLSWTESCIICSQLHAQHVSCTFLTAAPKHDNRRPHSSHMKSACTFLFIAPTGSVSRPSASFFLLVVRSLLIVSTSLRWFEETGVVLDSTTLGVCGTVPQCVQLFVAAVGSLQKCAGAAEEQI